MYFLNLLFLYVLIGINLHIAFTIVESIQDRKIKLLSFKETIKFVIFWPISTIVNILFS